MKKIAIFSLLVGIFLLAANVSFARDGSKISKTEVIPKTFAAPEQAIQIITLAVAPVAIVVDVSPAISNVDYAMISVSNAISPIQERFSPAEVPLLCDQQSRSNSDLIKTLHYTPPNTRIKEPTGQHNTDNSEGYQVKKE